MVKFHYDDIEIWRAFRESKKSSITYEEFEMVCEFHAKYFSHKFYKPCTCSPKTINKWIKDLNDMWTNGNY